MTEKKYHFTQILQNSLKFDFDTIDELLENSYIKSLKDKDGFHRFSFETGDYSLHPPFPTLVVEYNGGDDWLPVGFILCKKEVCSEILSQLPEFKIPDKYYVDAKRGAK